jgi:guanylate kinase
MIGKLFLICAPSGAGKTTLVNSVLNNLDNKYNVTRVTTYTSRLPRSGEIHGEHYFFLSEAEFEKRIQEDFFIEWSKSYGTYYGSPKSLMSDLQSGQSYILIVDNNGVKEIIKKYSSAIVIRISPPSFDVLIDRLNKRSTEDLHEIKKRLELASSELKDLDILNVCKYTIVNFDIENASNELRELIIKEICAQD